MPDVALEITRRAKSNLAFALHILPPERRHDMMVFYAFCRTMDDIADDPNLPPEGKSIALEAWRRGLTIGFADPSPLQQQLLELQARQRIPAQLFTAVVEGCQMDLQPQRFATWQDLDGYIWKVACAVGLVSIRLFGCRDAAAETYAVALGRSLQLTNILRDIGEDYDNGGRIYLPLEDLQRFAYGEDDLRAKRHDQRFVALMDFEAARAAAFFAEAAQSLPDADRKALAPARVMAAIYQKLLDRMRRGGFRVFERRYRVPRAYKLAVFAREYWRGKIAG